MKTQGLEDTELGRMYGKLEADSLRGTLYPHWMGKSAQVIDDKEVEMAPLHKRVRKHLKTKKIDGKRPLYGGRAL